MTRLDARRDVFRTGIPAAEYQARIAEIDAAAEREVEANLVNHSDASGLLARLLGEWLSEDTRAVLACLMAVQDAFPEDREDAADDLQKSVVDLIRGIR